MIEVELTPDMLSRAKKKAKEMGQLRNSITKGDGNVAGFLGEEMVLKTFNNFKSDNTYDSDIYFSCTKFKIKFEVKTKRCKVTPLPHHACSVARFNPNQKSHCYIFCRVFEQNNKGWIVGYMPREKYMEKAALRRVGELDPDDPKQEWTFKADCYNVPISGVKDPSHLYKINDYVF